MELNEEQKSATIADIINHLEIVEDYAIRIKNLYLSEAFRNIINDLDEELEELNNGRS